MYPISCYKLTGYWDKIMWTPDECKTLTLSVCLDLQHLFIRYFFTLRNPTVVIVEGPHSCFTFIWCPYDPSCGSSVITANLVLYL